MIQKPEGCVSVWGVEGAAGGYMEDCWVFFNSYLVSHRENNQPKTGIFWEAERGIVSFPQFLSWNSYCVCEIMSSLKSCSELFGLCLQLLEINLSDKAT